MATMTQVEAAGTDLSPELVAQVRGLSRDGKEQLVDVLFDELGYPPDSREAADRLALKAELTRRWEQLRSGEVQGIPAEEVIAALRRQAAERGNP